MRSSKWGSRKKYDACQVSKWGQDLNKGRPAKTSRFEGADQTRPSPRLPRIPHYKTAHRPMFLFTALPISHAFPPC